MHRDSILKMFQKAGLAKAESVIYLALLEGAESVKDIMRTTSEKRPTIYYAIDSLSKRGLISKNKKERGSRFHIEPVEKLEELIDQDIQEKEKLREDVRELETIFPDRSENKDVLISHFDTPESIRSAIFYSLYTKSKNIQTIVPETNFFHEIGEEFVKEYVIQKNKRGIHTQALWEKIPDKKTLDEYYTNADIRKFPPKMRERFTTTIFIYDDKTLYIPTEKNRYALLIQSPEHAEMMRALFNSLWEQTKALR